MKRQIIASALLVCVAAAGMGTGQAADTAVGSPPARRLVVDVRSDRIILMDVAKAGERLVAVGERGFALLSDDAGKTWRAVATPVTRTLTAIAFQDDKTGVAVGHGATLIRTDDAGQSWRQISMEEAGEDSLLGVTALGDGRFAAYGAFGLYFDSADGGRTWQQRSVGGEEFDRHISQVRPVNGSLFMVAESGTLAKSSDGGATWTLLDSPYQGSYFGSLLTRSGALLAFGMRGNIYRSTDGGGSWQKIDLTTTASLMSGVQLADGRLLLVGNAGLLAVSKDDGLSFDVHFSPLGKGFAGVVENRDGVLLVGESGVTRLDPQWLSPATAAAR